MKDSSSSSNSAATDDCEDIPTELPGFGRIRDETAPAEAGTDSRVRKRRARGESAPAGEGDSFRRLNRDKAWASVLETRHSSWKYASF